MSDCINVLDKANIAAFVEEWMAAWNRHDLEGVLHGMSDDVVFEHWTGRVVRGKSLLARVWQPWFAAHGDFRFEIKSLCIDQAEQTFNFEWRLEWPSPESGHGGQREVREGVDLIQLRDGKVLSKRSYIKTALNIGNRSIFLKA